MSPPVATLAAALRSERIKVTTVRANTVIAAAAAVVGLLTSWATATFVTGKGLTVTDVFVYPSLPSAVLAAIAGVVLYTSEVQHGTLAGALTARPSRWPVVAAKTVVAAGFGLLLGVVGLVTGALGALAGGVEVGSTAGVLSTVLWVLLFTGGAALLGLGVGMVVRHGAGAISGVLVWWLVVEGSVASFAPPEVMRFFPFDSGFRTTGVYTKLDPAEVVASTLSNPVYSATFWAYVVVALSIGTMSFLRRDVD